MKEQDWLTATHPAPMVLFMTSGGGRVSKRKTRLFASAVCRRVWHLMTDLRSRQAVETAERYADHLVADGQLSTAQQEAQEVVRALRQDGGECREIFDTPHTPASAAALAAVHVAARQPRDAALQAIALVATTVKESARGWGCNLQRVEGTEQKAQAVLLRHIVRSPFRGCNSRPYTTSAISELARAVYRGEVEAVPTLAHSLHRVGLNQLGNHFDEPGHPPGCWALDLLLGLS